MVAAAMVGMGLAVVVGWVGGWVGRGSVGVSLTALLHCCCLRVGEAAGVPWGEGAGGALCG